MLLVIILLLLLFLISVHEDELFEFLLRKLLGLNEKIYSEAFFLDELILLFFIVRVSVLSMDG